MSDVNMRRSQVILRMPVDHVTASLILHDGETSEVVVFLPPTEDIVRVLTSGDPFLPMIKTGKLCLVARDAIACLGIDALPVIPREDDLPSEKQRAAVKLRSGAVVEGELRWTSVAGQQRTADYLNGDGATFALYAPNMTFHIVKSHVATVEER